MKHLIIEMKAKCGDREAVRRILRSRNADFKGTDHQIDTYFQARDGRLKLREGNIENYLIFYKRGDKAGPKQSDVILFETKPGSPLKEILVKSVGIKFEDGIMVEEILDGKVRFYEGLISKLKTKIPIQYPDPIPRAYYQIPTGISSVHFEWAFHGRPRNSFGVELHLEKGSKEYNTKMINSLERLKTEIEEKTGEKVIFLKDWGRVWARLYIEKSGGNMTEELKKWAVEKMWSLYKILQPELDKMK